MSATRPVIGVLGGMGPEATLDFYAKVIAATPAHRDQEHLHLIIDADPTVPNRNDAVAGTGPSPAPRLAAMAARLEAAGADLLVMACNTAHAFQDAVVAAVQVPFVSILDETVAATLHAAPGVTRVGVLATSGAQDARLYPDAFARHAVVVEEPNGADRAAFMHLLYRVKAGDKGAEVRSAMRAIAARLVARGAEAIVAGCTEVPLVLGADDLPVPFITSTDALVDAVVAIGTGARPLPPRRP